MLMGLSWKYDLKVWKYYTYFVLVAKRNEQRNGIDNIGVDGFGFVFSDWAHFSFWLGVRSGLSW